MFSCLFFSTLGKWTLDSPLCNSDFVQLMVLQSRFGTDERFRMDSRFLEDENEEADNKAESGVASYLELLCCACGCSGVSDEFMDSEVVVYLLALMIVLSIFSYSAKWLLHFCNTERKGEKKTEEEEVLEDEKKRTLSILQSVLGSSQQTCSNKPSSKAKTFK